MKEIFYYSIFCKASWLSRPLGAKIQEQRNLRIQGRMQFFKKMSQKALNRILTLPNYIVPVLGFWFLPEWLIYKTTAFVNNSNTANLEIRPRCCIFWRAGVQYATWHVGVYDLACWGTRPSVLRANIHEQRNLRIQGRVQIFKNVPEGFKSNSDTAKL